MTPRYVECPECGRHWWCSPDKRVHVGQHTTQPDGPMCSFSGFAKTKRAPDSLLAEAMPVFKIPAIPISAEDEAIVDGLMRRMRRPVASEAL